MTQSEQDVIRREALEKAAAHARCAFDDRPYRKNIDWNDGFDDGTSCAARAVRALIPQPPAPDPRDARIKELEAKNARLREALKPFGDAAKCLDDDFPDVEDIWEHSSALQIDAGDLRQARAALEQTP